ncbi:MAG TPA: AMP-binding protein [Pseudonocardia sp.]
MIDQQPMIRCGEVTRTHAELADRAARIATGLRELGVGADDRIAMLLYNDVAFLEIMAAASLIGVASVPLNWHSTAKELGYVIDDCDARVIFVHSPLLALVREVAGDRTLIEVPVAGTAVDAPGRSPAGVAYRQLEDWLVEHQPLDQPAPKAPMSVIYTSGTTGSPKGVLREPADADRQAEIGALVVEGLGMSPGARTLIVAPMYHTAPNVQAAFAVRLGLDVTIMPRFDAEEVLALIERHRISHAQFVPTHFVRLLGLPPEVRARYDVSSLKSVVHAAAPCPPPVKLQIMDWFGPVVREFYGGTETGVVVCCDNAGWVAHPGTVGKPVLDADVRILDETRRPVPVGETGEVFVKPPSCWPDFTYIGDAGKRARMDVGGYLSIGDVGYLDEDGYLYLNDRAIDMVISGGVNIYPSEIENCLVTLSGVRDAAVFGIPDPDLGEALVAHVEVDPAAGLSEDDIRRHLREHLARFKTPKIIVFDDALPRQASGKLFKRQLKQRYTQGTASPVAP